MSTRHAPPAWPAGYGRIVLDEVDSTMAEAARRAAGPARPGWILARRQTAPHGRRGRAWVEPAGNFAATLVLYPDAPPAEAALRSYAAALALFDACAGLTGRGDRLALKWPNDLLLDGGKLAGILLESESAGRALARLAIGFGVNLAAAPDARTLEEGALPPVALAPATGCTADPETFLAWLAPAYAGWEERLIRDGFAPLREAWLARAAGLGAMIRARTGTEELRGRFEGLDAGGRLLLSTSRGPKAVAAGDIYF